MYIPYTEGVVLQYSGGAIGRQSFTQEERQPFLADYCRSPRRSAPAAEP
jgi:hypothetical protein